MIAMAAPSLHEVQKEFVSLLPQLGGRLARRFCYLGPEARADAVGEGIALAWETFLSARSRNKAVTASNLAFFAGRSVVAGRKLAGATSMDALSDTSVSRERIGTHVSLDEEPLGGGFYDRFCDKRSRWPVINYIAVRLDLKAFQTRCSRRDRRIMKMMAAGHAQTEIARYLKISPPAVNQRLRSLHDRWMAMTAA